MKLTIESTPELLDLDGVAVRRWIGRSEATGATCHVFVRQISAPTGQHELERELKRELQELHVEPPPGETIFGITTFQAGERYVLERHDGSKHLIIRRVLFDREIGRVDVIAHQLVPGGIRLSPRGDVPFGVVEDLRRRVVEVLRTTTGLDPITNIKKAQS